VHWRQLVNTIDRSVPGVLLLFQPVTALKWIRANEVTPISDTYFKIGGLHEDIDYEFRVAAENTAGLGPYSEVSSPVKTYVHKGTHTHAHTHARTHARTHAHTHTPSNGPLSGTTRVSWYQKGKTNLDFTGARDSEWQWHQLDHMQVCT